MKAFDDKKSTKFNTTNTYEMECCQCNLSDHMVNIHLPPSHAFCFCVYVLTHHVYGMLSTVDIQVKWYCNVRLVEWKCQITSEAKARAHTRSMCWQYMWANVKEEMIQCASKLVVKLLLVSFEWNGMFAWSLIISHARAVWPMQMGGWGWSKLLYSNKALCDFSKKWKTKYQP